MLPMDYCHEDPYCTVCNGTQDTPMSLYKKRAACRYYQAGNCRRGSNCPFPHVSIPGQVEIPATSHTTYQGEPMYNYPPLGPGPVYHPLDSQAYPAFLWQPYPLSPSFDPWYGFARQAEVSSDYPDDKSDPSSVESLSTLASTDYQLRMAHDRLPLEGVESRAVQGDSPPGDAGVNSPAGYPTYGCPVFPGVKAKHVAERGRATSVQFQGSMSSSSSLLPWQRDSRKKPLAYKTKPCKFYAENGKCTSGEKCTFIHDPATKGNVESPRLILPPPADAKLPPKPLNKYDECRARDFYPIAWRVIGGGVMMGGQRQFCPAFAAGHCKYGDDCRLAHETELEMDPVGFVEPKGEPVENGSPRQPNKNAKRSRLASQRPKSVKTSSSGTQAPVPFPSTIPHPERPNERTPGGEDTARKKDEKVMAASARDAPTAPVHRRTRSMSTVPTSPSPLDTAHSSYAAEL